jgi:pilus assembly protein CpaC
MLKGKKLVSALEKMKRLRNVVAMKSQKIWKTSFILFCICGFMLGFSTLAMAKVMTLEINEAEVLHFEGDVSEVFIANPDIADVQLTNPHVAYIYGKAPGTTTLFASNKKGQQLLKLDVRVVYNIAELKEMIAIFDPYELVEVKSIPGAIVLEGQVDSPKIAEEIRLIAEKYVTEKSDKDSKSSGGDKKQAKKQNVINRLSIKTPVQVNLRVKIAEVERTVFNNFAFDWQAVFSNIGKFNFATLIGRKSPGLTDPVDNPLAFPIATSTVQSLAPAKEVIRDVNVTLDSLGANYKNGHVDLNSVIDLLSKDGLVTVLAEPNLMAVSGETASFLAGGEFPYPVPQSFGNVTIEFKQYGVSLAFTPTVLDGRLISMRVRPEVSELDYDKGIQFQNTILPGITTRWAETTVELASGQTFAIAGLLHNRSASSISAVPGLGDLPVIGTLFRSNRFLRGDSELVILITPYLVEPAVGKEMVLPTDDMNFASFVEQIFERRLVKEGVQKGKAPAFGPGGVRLIGPAGFSIE